MSIQLFRARFIPDILARSSAICSQPTNWRNIETCVLEKVKYAVDSRAPFVHRPSLILISIQRQRKNIVFSKTFEACAAAECARLNHQFRGYVHSLLLHAPPFPPTFPPAFLDWHDFGFNCPPRADKTFVWRWRTQQ